MSISVIIFGEKTTFKNEDRFLHFYTETTTS